MVSSRHGAISIEQPSRLVAALYLTTLALLPWTWFPPFPWLHEHAQWSDVVFAATALLWAIDLMRKRRWPTFSAAHIALASYFIAAALSLVLTHSYATNSVLKLFGIGELCALALVTGDLATHPHIASGMARVTAVNALLIAAVCIVALGLFYAGISTPFIGHYGELNGSSAYARMQAGTYNPNLLASYCIFAASIVSLRDASLPKWMRRAGLVASWIAVVFSLSRGILGFILSALIRNARSSWKRILAVVTAVLFVAIMILLTVGRLTINPLQPFNASYHIEPLSVRYQGAATSLRAITERPVSGSGPDSHPGSYFANPIDSHMTLINIAATLGLPALVAFLSLLLLIWIKRKRPVDLIVWGGLAGLALDSLGQDIEDFRHLWVLIGIVLAQSLSRKTLNLITNDNQ